MSNDNREILYKVKLVTILLPICYVNLKNISSLSIFSTTYKGKQSIELKVSIMVNIKIVLILI